MNDEQACMPCEEPITDKYPPCPLQCRSPKCKSYMPHVINSKKTPVVWVVGGPGSGKRTICAKLAAAYNYAHLSVGDLLREDIKSGSDRANCLSTIMERNALVPGDIVMNIVKVAMLKEAAQTRGFFIDGYPCEKAQGIIFEKTIAPCTVMLYFEVSPATMAKRLQSAQHSPDITEETVRTKIQNFTEHNNEVLVEFQEKLQKINAEGSIDEIFKQAKAVLDPILKTS